MEVEPCRCSNEQQSSEDDLHGILFQGKFYLVVVVLNVWIIPPWIHTPDSSADNFNFENSQNLSELLDEFQTC